MLSLLKSWPLSFLLAVEFVAIASDDFTPLFNGRDLKGWINVNCASSTWVATNQAIYCTGVPTGELRTERMYQDFILELEWRHLRPKGNAGVFVWADAITAPGQPFIRGIEVQVLDGQEGAGHTSDGDLFPIHGAKMIPINGRGGDRAFPTEKRMKPSPEWNQYRVECVAGNISLAVNGKIVTRGTEATPRKGYICLESEGSPVEFRGLKIKELPSENALPPEHIANSDQYFQSVYNGIDLDRWQRDSMTTNHWRVQDWILAHDGRGHGLTNSVEIGDAMIIADYRWSDSGKSGDWRSLLGTRLGDEFHAPSSVKVNTEKKKGDWNRLQYTLRGNSLSVSLNGEVMIADQRISNARARGPWILRNTGSPVEWANLYVKRLD